MRKWLINLGVVLTICFGTARAQTIENGSFESAAVDPGERWIGLGVGNTSIEPWFVTSGNVDYIGARWSASEGLRSLDLNGNTAGAVSQSFTTIKGQEYRLIFYLAGNVDGRPTVKTLDVSIANTSLQFSFDTSSRGRQDMGWTEKALPFTAVDTLTIVTFASLVSGAYGPAIDNVRLESGAATNGNVSAGLLYSRHNSDSLFWSALNSNWPQYGQTELHVDYTTLNNRTVTYDRLRETDFDVLIIDNALSQPFNPPIFTDEEVAVLKRYLEEGHGLVVTGGTLRGNPSLAPLLGFSPDVGGQVFYQTGIADSVQFMDAAHPIFRDISEYTTFTSNFYSGSDWANDGGRGLQSDWQFVLDDGRAMLLAMLWNAVEGQPRAGAISALESEAYRSVFCGHTPVNVISLPDDYQFVYNMIGWASKTDDVLTSATAPVDNVPSSFELRQNYPNPFNPATTIEYRLRTSAFVELQIFNGLGQRVRTLVAEQAAAGAIGAGGTAVTTSDNEWQAECTFISSE